MVIAVLIGFWVSRNLRNWAATAAVPKASGKESSSSQLPAQEKQEIMVQVDRVAKAFREKTMSGEQLGELVEKLVQSPLMSSDRCLDDRAALLRQVGPERRGEDRGPPNAAAIHPRLDRQEDQQARHRRGDGARRRP